MAAEVLRREDPVSLPDAGSEGQLWGALLELAGKQPTGWTLVGGLMVMLHALETGLPTGRITKDVDVVAASRAVAGATRELSSALEALGWSLHPRDISPERRGFVFRRGGLRFDILAPDGLGRRADLTTLPPAQAVMVAGGSRALERTQPVAVRLADRAGVIPRPDLLGALVIKSAAARVDKGPSTDPAVRPERHREDLAVLYCAVDDPAELREAVTGKDLRRLRMAPEPTWEVVGPEARRQAGIAAYRILTG